MGGEKGVTRRREELVRVDDAVEGARDRFADEETRGIDGRSCRGVPDGVGDVARMSGSGDVFELPVEGPPGELSSRGYTQIVLSGAARATCRDGPALEVFAQVAT